MKYCVTFKTFLKHVNGEFTVCSLNTHQNVYALARGADVMTLGKHLYPGPTDSPRYTSVIGLTALIT